MKFKIFFRMDGEEPIFNSEEEVNKELEMMYLATDGEFIITKDDNFYCEGKLDKEEGYDIKDLSVKSKLEKVKTILKKIDERVEEFTSGFGDKEYYQIRDDLDKILFAKSKGDEE